MFKKTIIDLIFTSILLMFLSGNITLLSQEQESTDTIPSVESGTQEENVDEVAEETEDPDTPEGSNIRFSFNPTFGLTYFNTNNEFEDKQSLQWLTKLNSDFSYEGESYQFYSKIFLEYGQIHTQQETPEKFMDNFILTITPSMTIIDIPKIRLFLETTAETDIGDGNIGERKTSFMDPLVLYQTLFVGQKQFLVKSTDDNHFEITYGLGYAFQQTFSKGFKKDTLEVGDNTTFDSGLSAVFQIDMETKFSDNFSFKTDMKAVAISKELLIKHINSSRGSILLTSGFFYNIIGIEYNLRVLYDKNISIKRQLDQSLMITFSFDV